MNNAKQERIYELDFIRGILILLMLLQHLFYFFYCYIYCGIWNKDFLNDNIINFGNYLNDVLYNQPYCTILMNIGWCIFFTLSGINFHFSNNNKKRALILLISFSIYYLICFLLQNYTIYPLTLNFGIFLGYALYILFYELVKLFPFYVAVILTVIFFICSILSFVLKFNLEINPLRWFKVSQRNKMEYLDEWNLFPSIFFYSLGYILGKTLYKDKKSKIPILGHPAFKPLNFIGKYSKYFYIGNLIVFPVAFIITTYFINGAL